MAAYWLWRQLTLTHAAAPQSVIKALGVQRVMYRDEGDEVVRRYTHEKVTELKVGAGWGRQAGWLN